MKQLTGLVIFLFGYYQNLVTAQQTYIRNYSTFTEYGTIPAATVPSSYKPFSIPSYTYDKPEKKEIEEREETAEDRMRDRFSGISIAYQQGKYGEVISLSNGFDPSVLQPYYGRETFYAMLVNSYISLNRKKELVNYFLNAPRDVVMFSAPAFSLIVADELRAQNYFKEACAYFDKAKARGVYNKEFQLSYCIALAEVVGREQEARAAFDILLESDTTDAPLPYYYFGKFLTAQNREGAFYYLDRFIEKSAEKYDAYLLRARSHFFNKNYEQCIADAKEHKKNFKCTECDELILKATEKKSSPEFIAEQKRKQDELAGLRKQQEIVLAEQRKLEERAKIEQKQKAEADALVLKEKDEEFSAYISKLGIAELPGKKDVSSGKYATYQEAINHQDFKSVYFLWKQGMDINAEFGYKNYTLFEALRSDEFDIAQFLIINEFNLSIVTFDGTPLHLICNKGYHGSVLSDEAMKTAKMLISKGADVNATNEFGNTPLHNAASSGNMELAKLLLDNGAKTNLKNSEHRSPAAVARFFGRDEMIALLKEYK